MRLSAKFVTCITASAAIVAFAQDAPTRGDNSWQPTSSPAAYVYVSSSASNQFEINGFTAASDGALTAIPGSPFSTSGVSYMALNSKWLFGSNETYIYSFSIAADGALTQVSSINAAQYNSYDTGGPGNLFLDHTGATLYDFDIYGDGTGNNTYQSFDLNQNSGVLSYAGTTQGSAFFETPLSFIGNNVDAYGASCYHGFQSIYGFSRSGSGSLTDLNITPPIPAAPKGLAYCPYLAAADPTNHVAITMTPTQDGLQPEGPTQLGVYSADSSGNLTTTSTDTNMPQVAVGTVNDMWMSPAGNLLAVAGSRGLQVFHFNGANPITRYTRLLTTDAVTQMFWDDHNHLYAVSPSSGKVFVFTVTSTKVGEAPGSPYSIAGAENIIVLPK